MARIGERGDLLKCSFCGKSQKQVRRLIAGPGVYICNECVDLCREICEEEDLIASGEDLTHEHEQQDFSRWLDSAERQQSINLVTEAKRTLEHVLSLLALQRSNTDP